MPMQAPETKSNWSVVTEFMQKPTPLEWGPDAIHWIYETSLLSYYKFAAKMIGEGKRVLDMGSSEGLGTAILAKECGYACGIDEKVEWDALVCFTLPEEREPFFCKSKEFLTPEGMIITGWGDGKSAERLEEELQRHFAFVFLIAANGDAIHVGELSSAQYVLAVGCKKR